MFQDDLKPIGDSGNAPIRHPNYKMSIALTMPSQSLVVNSPTTSSKLLPLALPLFFVEKRNFLCNINSHLL